MRLCVACNKHINIAEILQCVRCKGNVHYLCVGIAKSEFTACKQDLERTWTCPDCKNVTRRPKHDNTPIRTHILNPTLDETIVSVDDQLLEDHSVLGDTVNQRTFSYTTPNKNVTCNIGNSTITLEQISQLLDEKLKNNTDYILSEMSTLKSDIRNELSLAIYNIKQELTNQVDILTQNHKNLKLQHETTEEKIRSLERQNNELQLQIKELQNNITTWNATQLGESNISKKIVIYGVEEVNWETEYDLQERVTNIFREILNIDLTGHIEELTWIGKYGRKRPLLLEMLSKKMTKFILHNRRYFKNTGITISEFLDNKAIQERRKLREILDVERKKGKHAIIRNNKLYVQGKEYILPQRIEHLHKQKTNNNENINTQKGTETFRRSTTHYKSTHTFHE